MKTYSFLFVMLFISGNCFAQKSPDKFAENMDKIYKEGNKAFLKEIYEKVRYPQAARENCRVGVLKTLIVIDTSGTVESVILANRLGMGIEAEVIRVLKLTSGKWIKGRRLKYPVNFAFRIGKSQKDIIGDINITAFAAGYEEYSGCSIPKKDLEKQVAKDHLKNNL